MVVVREDTPNCQVYKFVEDVIVIYTMLQFIDMFNDITIVDTIVLDEHGKAIKNINILDALSNRVDEYERE